MPFDPDSHDAQAGDAEARASREDRLTDDLERVLRYALTAKSVEIPKEVLEDATEALQLAKSCICAPAPVAAPVAGTVELRLYKALDALAPRVYPATAASLEISELMEIGWVGGSPRQREIKRKVTCLIRRWKLAVIYSLVFIFVMHGMEGVPDAAIPDYLAFMKPFPEFTVPIAFGFLGSCAFILRDIIQSISAQTFVPRESTMYSLRAILGIILGFIMPLLIGKNAAVLGGELRAVIIAFLAGYAVEPMFAALDNLVLTIRDAVSRGPEPVGGAVRK